MNGIERGRQRYSNSRPVKRTIDFHGIPVSIEFDRGETKRGIGDYGEIWTNTYEHPYGEIPTSRSLADRDGVDVYVGPDESSPTVYVVHQLKRDGSFDEDKVMLQFGSASEAESCYRRHGPSNRFGGMDAMTIDEFIHGYLASNRKIP